MTKLKRIVHRETIGGVFSQGKTRPVIVSLHPPNVIGFRLKGTRRTVFLTAEGCYMKALQIELACEKREKVKKRKKRR